MRNTLNFSNEGGTNTDMNGKRVPLAIQFGVMPSNIAFDAEALDRRLVGFARLWPLLVFATILGAVPQMAWLSGTMNGRLVMAGMALISLLPIPLFLHRKLSTVRPFWRVRLLTVASALLGVGFGVLASQAVDTNSFAALTCLSATGFVVVATLARLPVTMLAFATAAIGSQLAVDTSAIAILVLAPLELCALLIATSAARSDFANARLLWQAELDASRPARLIDELETSGSAWFWETDRRGRILYISERIGHALGTTTSELVGRPLVSIAKEQDGQGSSRVGERPLAFQISTATAFSEHELRANTKEELWWSISGRPIFDKYNQLRGFIGTGTDLTDKRKDAAEKSRLARFDALTGLANRMEIGEKLRQALRGEANSVKPAALFLIDLDRFKNVNDTLGHPAGDALLKQVAQRLTNVVGPLGHVGRLGGDEFKVVVPGKTSRNQLNQLASAIIESVSRPYFIESNQVSIGASIGIAASPDDGRTDDDLTRNADLALYAAKAAGRGVLRFYEPAMHAAADRRHMLEQDLTDALKRDALRVVYQPVVSCKGERVTGFEALLRWTHPIHGPISPAEFIPIAEESSLIEKVGEWVLRRACEEAARWNVPARIAVNVSPVQFANPAFPTLVAQVLAQTGLPSQRLELEITEGVFMSEGSIAERQFETLKRIGVRLALDDFGTGYSSLGYLQRAPLNKIKVDRSFVQGATLGDNQNAAIIRAIVTLAEALNMETTAEGAETLDEIELIRKLGCSHIQGYYYGPPLEQQELAAKLGMDGHGVSAVGHKVARSLRRAILRRGRIHFGSDHYDVRLRNISETGTMIEMPVYVPAGATAQIDIQDGPSLTVRVVWWSERRCGLAFDQSIDLSWLAGAAAPLNRAVNG